MASDGSTVLIPKPNGSQDDHFVVTIFDREPGSNRRGSFVAVDVTAVEAELDEYAKVLRHSNPPADLVVARALAAFENPAYWFHVSEDPPEGGEISFFEIDTSTGRIISQVNR